MFIRYKQIFALTTNFYTKKKNIHELWEFAKFGYPVLECSGVI